MKRSIHSWRWNLEKQARRREQRRKTFTRLHVEALEPRVLLASITLNPISNINEGNSVNLSGTYDVGGGSSSMPMLSIDWNGDGMWDQTQFPSGGSFSYSHFYGDDNPTNTPSDNMTVVAKISSFSSGTATASTSFTINNVAPSLSVSLSPGTVNTNQSVTLSGSVSDPGVSDSHTLRIDWDGNGTWDQTQGVMGSFFVNHSYSTPGTYNVNVSVTDDDTGSATGGGTVIVQSNSLSLNVGLSPSSINEGGSATLSGSYSGGTSSGMLMLHIDWDSNGTWDQTIYPSGGSFSTSHTWYDDHPSTGTPSDILNVTAMITDSFSSATASSTITVNNVAPSLNVSFSPGSINEGQVATLSGSYSDPGISDTHSLYIDWDNDGTYEQTQSVSGGTFSVSKYYGDDNPTATPSDIYNVNVKLVDDDTGSATAGATLTVNNVAPSLYISLLPASVFEGQSAILSGSYTDPGLSDTHTLHIDWNNDGIYDQTQSVSGGIFSFSKQYPDDNPTGTPSDIYSVNVKLVDDDTGSATTGASITVYNVAPSLNVSFSPASINEGETATLTGTYSDQGVSDTHTLYIDWNNDGIYDQTESVSGGTFSVTKHYPDDNPTATPSDIYNVNVKLVDDDTGSATVSATITVNNVAPSLNVSFSSATINEGETATLTGTYSDQGVSDTHTLYIDWDNNGIYDQTESVSGGTFSFTQPYPDDNPTATPSDIYNVNVKLVDDDTGSATTSATITVNNVAPSLSASFSPGSINEGQSATLTGTYSDPGVSDTHTLYIDWDNNGTYDQSQSVSGGNFSISHLFVDDHPNTGTPSDTLTVGVKLLDDDTGSTSSSPTIVVNNLDPSLSISLADDVIDESETATLNGTYTDPGISDTHSLYIDWDGDSTYDQNESVSGGAFTFTHHYGPISPFEVDFYKIIAELEDDDTGSDTASTTIAIYAQPDIDTDSNNDGTIDPDDSLSGTDDPIEETLPGRRIKVNLDDDNSNSTEDLSEHPVSGENDLAEVLLDINADTSGPTTTHTFEAALTFGTGVIKLWDSAQKDNEITAGTTWNLLTTAVPTTVWAEGIALGYETVTLELRVNSAVVKFDKIVLTVDPHVCTLRAAIMESNSDADHDTVTFDIGGNNVGTNPNFIVNSTGDQPDNNVGDGICSVTGAKEQHMADTKPTIRPQSTFPAISQRITINGGAGATPAIQVDGSGAGGNGFDISAANSTISGLAINRFSSSGIVINKNGATITGNFIGTDPGGTLDRGNGLSAITIENSASSTIGGAGNLRNVLSGNAHYGVWISGTNAKENTVIGNRIGMSEAGTASVPNDGGGVRIDGGATKNTIGSTTAGNHISGNGGGGVIILGSGTNDNVVIGNLIGTNAQGDAARANNSDGVRISQGASSNRIGGAGDERNVISGNKANGVEISGTTTTGNQVVGNLIGTNKNGNGAVPNEGAGVNILSAASNRIGVTADGTVIRNIISGNKQGGVWIGGSGADSNIVKGNYIGTNKDGDAALTASDQTVGVTVQSGANTNKIENNVISGNKSYGVYIALSGTDNTLIKGNKIGTKQDGVDAVENGAAGIRIFNGPAATKIEDNLISGNKGDGIDLDVSVNDTEIKRNKIGTNDAGTAKVGNKGHGIIIQDGSASNDVGGNTTDGNLISGNDKSGIKIAGSTSNSNVIKGNLIGTKAGGAGSLGNVEHGVYIYGANLTQIGGTGANEGNTIANNGGDGVYVESGTQNEIRRNSIHSNTGLGIDLGTDGVTAADTKDVDTGANNLQNFPVITSWEAKDGQTKVNGILHSAPNTSFNVEVFSNDADDPTGFGEGQVYRETATAANVTTDGDGNATWSVTIGQEVTNVSATATDPNGNTSEFGTRAKIVLEQIDFKGTGNVNIRIDESTDIGDPGGGTDDIEWIRNVRYKDNTTNAWETTQSAPAAFIRGNKMAANVKVSAEGPAVTAIKLQGKHTGTYGNFAEQSITISGGQNKTQSFESAAKIDTVAVSNVDMAWEVTSFTIGGADYPTKAKIQDTTHRIYTIFGTPVAPLTEPWATVLEVAAGMTAGKGKTNATDVVEEMTRGIHWSNWKSLDERFLKAEAKLIYDPTKLVSSGTIFDQKYPLTKFMTDLKNATFTQQCSDNANLMTIFSAAIGITATPTYLQPDGAAKLVETAKYYRAGDNADYKQKFDFHQFNIYDGKVYDPSTRPNLTGDPNMGSSLKDYLDAVFPGQIAAKYKDDPVTVKIMASPLLAAPENVIDHPASDTEVDPSSHMAETMVIAPDDLDSIVRVAKDYWREAGADIAPLKDVSVSLAALGDGYLGLESGGSVWIDVDADGHGWFVDRTPRDHLEFQVDIDANQFVAFANGPAGNRFDLLTVVTHELGHALGLLDLQARLDPADIMTESLSLGTRRLPDANAIKYFALVNSTDPNQLRAQKSDYGVSEIVVSASSSMSESLVWLPLNHQQQEPSSERMTETQKSNTVKKPSRLGNSGSGLVSELDVRSESSPHQDFVRRKVGAPDTLDCVFDELGKNNSTISVDYAPTDYLTELLRQTKVKRRDKL